MKEMSMKRIVAFLMVLTAGWGLLAQELKFDGYLNSGLGVVATDQAGVDPYVTAFGVDSWQPGYRFRLNGAYTNGAANAGVRFRFQSQAALLKATVSTVSVDGLSFSLPYLYGWIKLFDGVITLNGGLVDDATWNTGGALLSRNDTDQGEGLGVLIKLSPFTGLDLGVGAYTVSIKGSGDNNVLAAPLNSKIELDDIKYTFNLGYTLADVFKFTANLRTTNTTAGATRQSSRAIAGIRLLAVTNLTALLEAEFNQLQDFGNRGTLSFYETLGYKAGSLGFGLNAGQHITQVTGKDVGLEFAPWLDYTLGKIVPRLDLVYFLGGSPVHGATSATWTGAYNRIGYTPDYNDKLDVLSVRPSAKFNIGDDGKTFIEVGDILYFTNVFTDTADTLINVFYIDFKWSF
jgi:hypothetical protein